MNDPGQRDGRLEVGTVAPSERTTAPMAAYSMRHVKIGLVVFVLGVILTIAVPLVVL